MYNRKLQNTETNDFASGGKINLSLNLILAENLDLLQKLILFCSAIFILIWRFKIWRHSTVLIALICGAIVTMSAAYHTTVDVSFIIIGWWALPWGYFMTYRSYNELLRIEDGLPHNKKVLWLIGLFAPSWLLFTVYVGYILLLVLSPILIIFDKLNVLTSNLLNTAIISILAPAISIYFLFTKFVKPKLLLFEKEEFFNSSTYTILLLATILSFLTLGFEIYSITVTFKFNP